MVEDSEENKLYSVLLVESDKRESDRLKYIFEGLYNFNVRQDASSAIELIEREPPDVLLTEINFASLESFLQVTEQMSGFQLCEYVKNHKNRKIKDIHIIFLSDTKDSKDIARAFELGASDFIKKPYDVLDVFSRVEIKIQRRLEKQNLYDSIKELVEDKRVRNKKNLDFRTTLFNKHKSEISKYQIEIEKLKDELSAQESKIVYYKRFQSEAIKLRKELDELKKRVDSENNQQLKAKNSDENIDLIKKIYFDINTEFKFEERKIKEIVSNILGAEVSFEKIDNLTFINNIVDILKIFTRNELLNLETEPPLKDSVNDHLDALTEYIVKTYLNHYLFYFAVSLLESIGTKSDNAINFLKFYNGKVEISPSGVRFQKPVLQGDNGQAWNLVSVMQIATQRAKGKDAIAEQKRSIDNTEHKLQNVKNQIHGILSREKLLTVDELKSKQSFSRKIEIMEDILLTEKKSIPRNDKDSISEIELKIIKLHNIDKLATKYENFVEQESKQLDKLINYYKPTEEKFSRVALSIAKSFLKIKIIK